MEHVGPLDPEGFKVMFAYFGTCYAQEVRFTWNMFSIAVGFDIFHLLVGREEAAFYGVHFFPFPCLREIWRKINTETRARQV